MKLNSKATIIFLLVLTVAEELLSSPVQFPEEPTSLEVKGSESPPDVGEEIEPRFHHGGGHRKKKRKKKCKRIKRDDGSEGRFFFPILNYYDTNVYVANGGSGGYNTQTGEGCESGLLGAGGGGGESGLGGHPFLSKPGLLLGALGNVLGENGNSHLPSLSNSQSQLPSLSVVQSQLPSLSGLGSQLPSLSGIGSNFPSIGSGIPPFGYPRPPQSSRPPAGNYPQTSRPPVYPSVPTTQRPYRPPQTSRPPPPVATTDPDSEDYDYSDFSTTRTRPLRPQNNPLADYPLINSINSNVRPALQRPQKVFNDYVVRPINKTIREFYSLFK